MNLLNETNRNNETKENGMFKFMAMSKFIGVVAFAFVFMITIYAMIEMHKTQTYAALPQLIISAFGFASVYAGFYLLMAKVEHVEVEKTKREKELIELKTQKAAPELIAGVEQEIKELADDIGNILVK